MRNQTLTQEFYDLKADILKKMQPQSCIYLYFKDGSGFAIRSDDMIMYKFYPMTGDPPSPCDLKEVLAAYKLFLKKDLTEDEYLQLAITRFKEILAEMDKQKQK